MKVGFRTALVFAVIVTAAQAQHAPVPPALLSAKTVFLSNAGSDAGLFPHPFTGTESRGYDQLYAALATWSHYTLVDSPAKADLVLEIRLIAPSGPSSGNKVNGASDPLPMFRLTVYDRPTHYVLWAFGATIDAAALQKSHDRNFDDSIVYLVENFKTLVTK